MSIEQDISGLSHGNIVLLETPADKAMDSSIAILDQLVNKNGEIGIVVTANRPYSNLVATYEQKGIDIKRILFIDCISKSQSANLAEGNVLYLDSVEELTKISISITESMKRIKGDRFVFIDSITTMLIHNNPEVFARFIHGILTKMRINNTSGVLLSIGGQTNDEVRAEIAQLCDRVVKA